MTNKSYRKDVSSHILFFTNTLLAGMSLVRFHTRQHSLILAVMYFCLYVKGAIVITREKLHQNVSTHASIRRRPKFTLRG